MQLAAASGSLSYRHAGAAEGFVNFIYSFELVELSAKAHIFLGRIILNLLEVSGLQIVIGDTHIREKASSNYGQFTS